jgi:hypothetical protein
VDNSLQVSAGSFSFTGMRKSALLIAPVLFFSALIGPPPSSAEPLCDESGCVETFVFTESTVIWEVPPNAVNLRFDVYGAQGGRNGGRGGRISGAFGELPEQLYITVGGQGLRGSNLPGGFNGGGISGGNRADEGSGGGASDIRVGPELSDRIIVAGGGGGTGGWSGAAGGAGGGLRGQNGFNGQGGGGGGGSQTAGGAPGFTNGGTLGTAGSFGSGGTGGSSQSAGGGGGGGGWYGGGGGGSDIDTCCMDGGGGGGGSSHSYSLASDVQHQQGARSGNGLIIISYQLIPTVISFVGEQLQRGAIFSLEFSEPVTDLELSDFELVTGDCELVELSGTEASYQIELQNCSEPALQLILAANSVTAAVAGPPTAVTANLELDFTPPTLSWRHEPFALEPNPILILEHLGAESFASESDFTITGCESFSIEYGLDELLLNLEGCREGEVVAILAANSFADEHGNSAPSSDLEIHFVVDLLDPTLSWQAQPMVLLPSGASLSVTANFSEPVSYDLESALEVGGSANCEWSAEASELAVLFSFEGCDFGALELSWQPQSLTDASGRQGPVTAVSFELQLSAPAAPRREFAQPASPPTVADEADAAEPEITDVPKTSPVIEPQPQPSGTTVPISSALVAQADAELDAPAEEQPQPQPQAETTSVARESRATSAEPAVAVEVEASEFALGSEPAVTLPLLVTAGVAVAGAAVGVLLLLRRRLS